MTSFPNFLNEQKYKVVAVGVPTNNKHNFESSTPLKSIIYYPIHIIN